VPTTPLAPRHEKPTHPRLHEPVDLTKGATRMAITEVLTPSPQITIQLLYHRFQGISTLPLCQISETFPHPSHALGRRFDMKIGPLTKQILVIAKGKAQEVQACPLGTKVYDPCFVSVQAQLQATEHLVHKVGGMCQRF